MEKNNGNVNFKKSISMRNRIIQCYFFIAIDIVIVTIIYIAIEIVFYIDIVIAIDIAIVIVIAIDHAPDGNEKPGLKKAIFS